MKLRARWDRCVYQRGDDVRHFISDYLAANSRSLLLIAGAGFDPRSTVICNLIASRANCWDAIFLREERPSASNDLRSRALANVAQIKAVCPRAQFVPIQIFANDGAVIGGREAAKVIDSIDVLTYTDVLVDVSSLSKGVTFPIVRHLLARIQAGSRAVNVHLFVTEESQTDRQILEIASDRPGMIAGFSGEWGLDSSKDAAKLWLPQLISGQQVILEMIFKFLDPDDTCPILPFPALNPRLPDELIAEYGPELQSRWEVEPGDLVFAHERNPLDLYRTILSLADARSRVFEGAGGSQIILSPLGSKVLAIGALMASLDRNFPVAYVEAIDYKVNFDEIDQARAEAGELVHVWLHGDAYGL